jgi:hypothetical protein
LSKRSGTTAETNPRGIASTFWLCIGANLIGSAYASIQARGLYSDGAAYLVGIYQDHWFLLFDTRTVVQVLRQAPVVLASRYTSASLFECGQLFSFVMLALPWVLCSLCWFVLPKNQKQWMVFPLLATLAGWMATSIHAIGESAIATGYEWLLLLLVLFRAKSIAWMLLWIVLLLPAFRLHEGTFPFLVTTAVSAIMAYRSASSRIERIFLGLGIIILIWTIADQIFWVAYPQFPLDRDNITRGLLNGEFLYYDGHFNLQLVNGIAALLILMLLTIAQLSSPGQPSKIAQVIVATWVLFCVGSVICATMVAQSFAPFAHLQARYHPPLLSTVLAATMLALVRYVPLKRFLASSAVHSVIAMLSAIQLVTDIAATQRWNAFVSDLQFRLMNNHGLIPWETTIHTGNLRADENWQLVKIGWVVPYFSIIYAPNGVVRAIINCPVETRQPPFNPAETKQLPRLNGVDYSLYEQFLLKGAQVGQ